MTIEYSLDDIEVMCDVMGTSSDVMQSNSDIMQIDSFPGSFSLKEDIDQSSSSSTSSGETVASDLTPFLPDHVPTKPCQRGPERSRSAGKIMQRRKMHWMEHGGYQGVKWDREDDSTMSLLDLEKHRILAKKLRHSACEITWTCAATEGNDPARYSGQGGLVRGPDGKMVKFLTVAQNLCSEANHQSGEWEEAQMGHRCFTVNGRCDRFLNIPRTGWECTEAWSQQNKYSLGKNNDNAQGEELLTWKYGVDISLGPEVSDDDMTTMDLRTKLRENDIVSNDFVYEEGMELGMAVFTTNGPNYLEESLVNGIEEDKLPAILGSANELVIFTGIIKKVGAKHIEHDLNSFGGCSGALLIVLSKGHKDFGKVAAVHAGSIPGLDANIGFKVAKAFSHH